MGTLRWLLALVLATVGCGPQPAQEPASSATKSPIAAAQLKGESKPAAAEPSVEIPEGTPEELFAFLEQLELRELGTPEGNESEDAPARAESEQAMSIQRVMQARVAVAEKILARSVPEETRTRAIRIKLDALRTLAALDPDRGAKPYQAFVDRLMQGSDPFLRRMAQVSQFQAQVNKHLAESEQGGGSEGDGKPLLQKLETLLADPEAGPETLDATRDAFGWVFQAGDIETATEGFLRIGQRFQSHPDENLAAEANSLVSQATNIRLAQLAKSVVDGKQGALEDLLAEMKTLVAPENHNPNALAYAMQTAQFFEFSGYAREAQQAYQLILERYQNDDDAQLVADVRRSVTLAQRRLGLVGSELKIEGVRIGSDSFNWDDYRGKWVLVCFWTTWHTGWPQELQNIRQAIGPFRDPPIEVVSISLDDDRNLLERYLRENPTAWPVVVDPDPNAAGFENANAVRCGVEAVPFILLVDPTGKVADIHLMGERLATVLQQKIKRP